MLLYIHIPFCDSKCYYCAFNSFTNFDNYKEEYFNSLIKQFQYEIARFNLKKGLIETLFIGGGTPSTIGIKLYKRLFNIITPYLKKDCEITIEANPNRINSEWLNGILNLGVNRLSLGVQSFNNKKLQFLGRTHSAKMAINGIEMAKKIGFSNISIDIIYNTAIDNKKLLKNDIDIAISLGVSHISGYSLTIEKGTKFFKSNNKNLSNRDFSKFVIENIVNSGLKQYEISNFGKISKHNFGYWQYKNYIGIGSGAVGFLNNRRIYPNKSIKAYIKNPLEFKEEFLTEKDILTEKLFLGFRSIIGVKKSLIQNKKINTLLNEGLIVEKGDRYYNTNFLIADEITLFLID